MPPFLLALALLAGGSPPQERPKTVEELKALFIYNFATDAATRWPAQAFAAPDSPLVIGLLSPDDALFEQVTLICKGAKANGRPIEVQRAKDPGALSPCHLVYVAPGGRDLANQVIRQSRNRPVLTVSENPNFCAAGGILNLFLNKENKYKFEANPDAAVRAGLSLTAGLLRQATIVREEKQP